MTSKVSPQLVTEFSKRMVDDGLIIAAGWEGFKLACLGNQPISEIQAKEMGITYLTPSIER